MTTSSPIPEALLARVPADLQARVIKHWQHWRDACERQGVSNAPGTAPELLGYIWACSEFAAGVCNRRPKLWHELVENGWLQQSFALADYQKILQQKMQSLPSGNDAALMEILRLFRHQHMLRIAWRDLAGVAATAETLANLTDLAEVCVDLTLEKLYQEACQVYGEPHDHAGKPQRLIVLGMGKFGGHELNFSSDIDLIFSFAEEGETTGERALAISEFFTRLGQRLIRVLNEITADGFVFRVDMRLRPYGDSGPLVMSYDAMEEYYQTQGRDWERYAMIKARVVAGDRAAGDELMAMLRPFVYRRYLDFGAFESIREMKAMIDTEVKRKGNLDNIKLGLGGIREIEFIGQTYQLLRGGGDNSLQVRGIIHVLNALAAKGLIEHIEAAELIESYDFLRRLENRLQMYADGQTHVLPADALIRRSMALAMNVADWDTLAAATAQHRRRVHDYFNQTFAAPELAGDTAQPAHKLAGLWRGDFATDEAQQILAQLGFADAEAVWQQLESFRNTSQVQSLTGAAQQRLDKLMPLLLQALPGLKRPAETLKRLLNLLQAIVRRSVYLALLIEYPSALTQMVRLCAASPWMASLLTRYPVLLDELLDPRTLYEIPMRAEMQAEINAFVDPVLEDEERAMEHLRKFKQAQMLRVAAMDLAGSLEVFTVSDQLTLLGELLLDKACQLAWARMVERHGRPTCKMNGALYYPVMAVIGYGKLGGREIGYGSDLDLVFLHDSQGDEQQTDGASSVDNNVFFARLAQRLVHVLATQTANGRLYEIDTRLRPDGASGMLVSGVQAFDQYQHTQAWTWEHQALIRARMISGNAHLTAEFDRIRRSVLTRQRDAASLRQDVLDMRQKMREALGSKQAGQFHLKHDAGGMVDIEFIAQYGVLSCAHATPPLLEATATRKLLRGLQQCNWLTQAQADVLYSAYAQYRQRSHQRALQEQSSTLDATEFADLRAQVTQIWNTVFNL